MSKPLSVGVEQQNYPLVEAHKQAISTKKITAQNERYFSHIFEIYESCSFSCPYDHPWGRINTTEPLKTASGSLELLIYTSSTSLSISNECLQLASYNK